MATENKDGFKEILIEPLQEFARDSMHLVKKCTKPDRKEFMNIAKATATGFFIMGFIGFFVKLVHIPINNVRSDILFFVLSCFFWLWIASGMGGGSTTKRPMSLASWETYARGMLVG